MTVHRRRTLLAALSTTAISAVAGCSALTTGNASDSTDSDGSGADGRDESIAAVATRFVEDLAADRVERAHERIGPAGRDAVSIGELEQLWLGYAAVGGEFREVSDATETSAGEFEAVDLTVAFERGDHELRVLVDDESEVAGVSLVDEYERPEYVDPDAVAERDVSLETDACSLPGTVTTPADAGDGSVPGVVLVHDADPADRNVEKVATRAFADLARGLATRGVATIRYDKRTYACPEAVAPEDHSIDAVSVDDALTAIDELRSVDPVDGDRVVVAGLGVGGLVAPRIAARDGGLAGAVALAAPARPFHEVVVDHLEHQATVGSHEWPAMTRKYEEATEELDRVRDGEYDADEVVLDFPGALWESLDAYDHLETARDVDVPLYVLQGERDFQVSPEDDLERWRSELADRPATSFERYEGLNHLFMPGEGPAVVFEYYARNNVDERVVADVADWIDAL